MGIGENIKKYREARGMSQSDVARRLGVSRACVSLWEHGESRPKMGNVEALSGVFGVPVSTLVGDERHYAVSHIDPTEEERLLAAYASMSADRRAIALATVEAMAGVR